MAVGLLEVSDSLNMKKYLQSHVPRDEMTYALTEPRGLAELFDGIAEVWLDAADFTDDIGEQQLLDNIRLIEDERKFIDFDRSVGFFTTEYEVF